MKPLTLEYVAEHLSYYLSVLKASVLFHLVFRSERDSTD